jgi:hypothetical protein
VEVVTDRAAVYPRLLDELIPAAWHHSEQYGNNKIKPTTVSSNAAYGRCDIYATTAPPP